MAKELASILVGDHLGQVKKILWPSGEVSSLSDCAESTNKNPVVSIEQIGTKSKHLIGNRNGELYIYDSVRGQTKSCETSSSEPLVKALPINSEERLALIHEKAIIINDRVLKQKKGQIRDSRIHDTKLAVVGQNVPLRIFDLQSGNKTYEADPPEKDWLGIQPECYVAGLSFVSQKYVATCSKSDSVIRVYDPFSGKPSPIIKINIDQTAFNEHAESGRFMSIASNGADDGRSIVVGSNVGQILAIDLRFHAKPIPKKKLQPKQFKILGGFKGARGASITDLEIVTSDCNKVISCCLDRYVRIHNFSKNLRTLDKHVYLKTKPTCCSPVFYE